MNHPSVPSGNPSLPPHPDPGPDCIPVDRIPFLAARSRLPDHLAVGTSFGLDLPPGPSGDISRAWFQVMRLKRLFRRGWLRVGIPEEHCETVAEHSCGVAMLCLLHASSAGVDGSRAALMALVHELGETHTGDLTPHDRVAKADKHRMEQAAIDTVLSDLEPVTADRFRLLWNEYEAQSSPEARFVKQMDFLEMGSQAAVYAAEGYSDAVELLESARRGLSGSPFAAFLSPRS